MGDDIPKSYPIRELLLILGMGGGSVGTAVYQGRASQELITSNMQLAEKVSDSFTVKEVLERQRDLEIKLAIAQDNLDKWERRIVGVERVLSKGK